MAPTDLSVETDVKGKTVEEYGDWIQDLQSAGRVDYGYPKTRAKNSLLDSVTENYKIFGEMLRMMGQIEANKNLTVAQRDAGIQLSSRTHVSVCASLQLEVPLSIREK